MSCLKYQSLDDYCKSVDQLSKDDELIIEYQKNYYLSERIKRTYNLIRSRVFIDFVAVIDKYSNKSTTENKEKIKKAINDCVLWCDTYLNIASIYDGFERKANVEPPAKDNLIKAIKKTAKRCFAYLNTLEDFCIKTRNYAAYLLAKLFNERCNDFDRVCHYDEELSFVDEKDIISFENNELLEVKTTFKDIIYAVLEAFYIDLSDFDDTFILHLEFLSEESKQMSNAV